jgi:hypothetical protein
MDAGTALGRMRELLRPGGKLILVGLARSRFPADLAWEAAAVAANLGYRLTRSYWQQPGPTVLPPPETYPGMRQLAAALLPGAQYRRLLLWRYLLAWTKPGE